MAAHDDKISSNRRRLFKALSAAPVVTTLSPGSALAGSSSHTCLAETPTASTPVHLQEMPTECDGGEDCLAYVARTYWDSVGLDGDCLAAWNDRVEANNVIVDTRDDGSILWTVDMASASYPGLPYSHDDVSVDGTELTIETGPPLDVPCVVTGKTGYFLLAINPLKDDDDYVDFGVKGVHPEETEPALVKSCWNSFDRTSGVIKFIQG